MNTANVHTSADASAVLLVRSIPFVSVVTGLHSSIDLAWPVCIWWCHVMRAPTSSFLDAKSARESDPCTDAPVPAIQAESTTRSRRQRQRRQQQRSKSWHGTHDEAIELFYRA